MVKIGRTELQDAVLMTLGREMSAYAEAIARDRWRIYKCEERLRTVNLGGTAIGTALGAPRQYVFRVVEQLRQITCLGLARAENLVDATQNADVFVEVSGILRTLAANLLKISNDLRLLSSGPHAGLGEIHLPARQAGSSIMPGKVNPVIPEAVGPGGAWRSWAHDQIDPPGGGGGQPGTEPVSAAGGRQPVGIARPAGRRLRYFRPLLRRRHRGRSAAMPAQRPKQHGHAHRPDRADRLRGGRAPGRARRRRRRRSVADDSQFRPRPRPAGGGGIRRADLARAQSPGWAPTIRAGRAARRAAARFTSPSGRGTGRRGPVLSRRAVFIRLSLSGSRWDCTSGWDKYNRRGRIGYGSGRVRDGTGDPGLRRHPQATIRLPFIPRARLSAMKTKTFDCVEMKRRGAERIHEATKATGFEQKVAYWQRQSQQFREQLGKRSREEKDHDRH